MIVEAERPALRYRWYHKLLSLLLIVTCLELGLFLVIFPWSRFWDDNFFSTLSAEWSRVWPNPYVRGGVSGLGLLNLYIAIVEILRIGRFWSKPE